MKILLMILVIAFSVQTYAVEQAPNGPPDVSDFDLSDLDSIGKSREQVWDTYSQQMEKAFLETEAFALANDDDLAIVAWQRFLEAFAVNNPFSERDEVLRNVATNASIGINERITEIPSPVQDIEPLKAPVESELSESAGTKGDDETDPVGPSIAKSSDGEYTSNQVELESKGEYAPAQFRFDSSGLLDNIVFPPGDDDVGVLVRCASGIEKNGKPLYGFYCTGGNDQTIRYESKVSSALRYSKMRPAEVRGKRKRVRMTFSVIFERRGGVENISFLPNHLLNLDQFGADYIAPQLLYHSARGYPPRCALNVVVQAVVDIEGRVTDAEVLEGQGSDKCKRNAANYVKNLEFIPGFVNGKPTAMNHQIMMMFLVGWLSD